MRSATLLITLSSFSTLHSIPSLVMLPQPLKLEIWTRATWFRRVTTLTVHSSFKTKIIQLSLWEITFFTAHKTFGPWLHVSMLSLRNTLPSWSLTTMAMLHLPLYIAKTTNFLWISDELQRIKKIFIKTFGTSSKNISLNLSGILRILNRYNKNKY